MTRNDWTIERKTFGRWNGYGKDAKIVEETLYFVKVPTVEGTKECGVETLEEACDIVKMYIENFTKLKRRRKEHVEYCSKNPWTYANT